jgi:hypothetical protein
MALCPSIVADSHHDGSNGLLPADSDREYSLLLSFLESRGLPRSHIVAFGLHLFVLWDSITHSCNTGKVLPLESSPCGSIHYLSIAVVTSLLCSIVFSRLIASSFDSVSVQT